MRFVVCFVFAWAMTMAAFLAFDLSYMATFVVSFFLGCVATAVSA